MGTEYESKLAMAKQVVDEHNQSLRDAAKALPSGSVMDADRVLPPKPPAEISWDNFVTQLQAIGGISAENLAVASWDDLQKCGLPPLLARRIADGFRVRPSRPSTSTSTVDAVRNYKADPDNPTYQRRLRNIVNDRKCLVFDLEGNLNEEATIKVVDLLRTDRQGSLQHFEVQTPLGKFSVPLYAVGTSGPSRKRINPLAPNLCLMAGSICTISNYKWEIPDRIMLALLYAVRDTKELTFKGNLVSNLEVQDLTQNLEGKSENDQWDWVTRRFPKAALRAAQASTDELYKTVWNDQTSPEGKPNNPFPSHLKT